MKQIADILKEHAFFKGLSDADIAFIAGCAKNVVFQEKQVIANHGDTADQFYLIREGQVSMIIDIPPRKICVFQSLGADDILGYSWLVPPYQWPFSAYATMTTRAIAIDGTCLRNKCESDPRLGFELMKRLVTLLIKGENTLRLQLMDVYG